MHSVPTHIALIVLIAGCGSAPATSEDAGPPAETADGSVDPGRTDGGGDPDGGGIDPGMVVDTPARDEFCREHADGAHTHDGSAPHPHDPERLEEHEAAMGLVTEESATHIAIHCGMWSDPNTWRGREVPLDGADVLIAHGVGVTFDLEESPALHYVKVEGFLEFDPTRSTHLRVDTLISAPHSYVVMGSQEAPMPESVSVRVTFPDGPIDQVADPFELSRGAILHGNVSIHGAPKTPFVALADAPSAGQDTLRVEREPVGWTGADRLLVVGTHFNRGDGRRGVLRSEDEQVGLVGIDGAQLRLDSSLAYDHDAPAGHELHSYVANLSRNIVFESENPAGVRGHFMIMHSDAAMVRFASFVEMGRTSRSLPAGGENVLGRYPLHVHRSGTAGRSTVVFDSNVIQGGPGWGIVHHDSVAAVNHNVVFDVAGSGIVAEAGSEVGEWVGNLVSTISGGTALSVRDSLDQGFGPGSRGECYTLMTRGLFQHGNVAANCLVGWSFEGRIGQLTGYIAGGRVPDRHSYRFDPLPLHDWESSNGDDPLGPPDPDFFQIIDFRDNEAFAAETAIRSTHRGSWYRAHTDLLNEFVGFRGWRIQQGMDFASYSWDYTFRDIVLIGEGTGSGFLMFTKIENFNFIDVEIVNFRRGINYAYSNFKGVLRNVVIRDTTEPVRSNDSAVPLTYRDEGTIADIGATLDLEGTPEERTIRPRTRRLELSGTVHDSFGSYPFSTYRHWDGRGSSANLDDWTVADDYDVQFIEDSPGGWTPEELVAVHGALLEGGRWTMPVAFWVGDRLTGKSYAIRVDFPLEDFDETFLEEHRLETFALPSNEVDYVADHLTPP
ncbi:MAG: G8 domain-containing protein [Deltaproteobacteria bacterium]|nr:G8 domain-containing protein [Deltaproteobacteria bacterium]